MSTVIQAIATQLDAWRRCCETGNTEWESRWCDRLYWIEANQLPSGAGIDTGTDICFERSIDNRIVLEASYHVMNENGMYDGWIDLDIVVRPSLIFGIEIEIREVSSNLPTDLYLDRPSPLPEKHADLVDYLHDTYREALLADERPAQCD